MTRLRTGDELPEQRFAVTRADLVRYAGASGDRNPIHWSDRIATSVGLPGVVAHGMFTMALAARALDVWAGSPGRVREIGCKFTKPVVVPDDETGAEVVVNGRVAELDDGQARITLEVTCAGEKVLGAAKAVLEIG
jgi:acyl dehydratase